MHYLLIRGMTCLGHWNGFNMVSVVGNLGLLRFHALDLIKFMHLSLRISRSNIVKINGLKPLFNTNLESKTCTYNLEVSRLKSI